MILVRIAVLLVALLLVAGCADDRAAVEGDILPSAPLPADEDRG